MTSPESRPLARGAAVIGAGPAGLMAATRLAAAGWTVSVFDRMPSPARRLLIAGRGGLNLTHSEPLDRLLDRYGPARDSLAPAIRAFPPDALRAWCHALGQPTFTGSSGRVFPEAFKAAPLLRAWLRQLAEAGVTLHSRHRWTGWDASGRLAFDTLDGPPTSDLPRFDATVLALGGASWPRLGADGAWTAILSAAGVAVAPLRPSNCGVAIAWSDRFRTRFEGTPLKRLALRHGDATVRGEAVVTAAGLEGGAVYALSAGLRDTLARDGAATLHVDLRPDLDAAALAARLAAPRRAQSLSTFLRKQAGLAPAAIALLHEAARPGPDLSGLDPAGLAARIRSLPLAVVATAGIERAISSAGGIALGEIDANCMLRRLPGVFAAGEMLDWEAPTGGYLLQAAFSTGFAAAEGVLRHAARVDTSGSAPSTSAQSTTAQSTTATSANDHAAPPRP